MSSHPAPEADDVQRAEREARLEAALDKGELPELPPNQPKGILGERGFDLYKTDTFEPDLNSGVSQELDAPVRWMGIMLAYLIFFPLGYWLLWRGHYSRRVKIGWSIAFAAGIVWVVWSLSR